MAKKRTSLSQTLFGEINPYGSNAGGQSETRPGDRQARLLLEVIRPDPDQPRQLLPAALNQAVARGELAPGDALRQWLRQFDEANGEISAKHNLQELRRLATSIEQHGLINPITVRRPRPGEALPAGAEYFIVTGERRYWSHVLLALEGRQIQEGNEITAPDQIKALIANEGVSVRAHQLIENLLREDINAVEKARGLWALRYELSGVNHGSPFSENFSSPARVNRGSPSGKTTPETALVPWNKVEETLGISKRYRIFVTSVLNLCTEAQDLVARYDLSERLIRPIVQKLKDRADLQVEALRQVAAWREEADSDDGPDRSMVASTQGLVDQLLAREEARMAGPAATRKTPVGDPRLGAEQFKAKVQGALRFLNRLDEPDLAGLINNLATTSSYTGVVDDLRDLRDRIDTILDAITVHGSNHHPPRR